MLLPINHHLSNLSLPSAFLNKKMTSLLQAWALPATLLAIVNISATWFNLVSSKIPEPYLVSYEEIEQYKILTFAQDEFFHVPQAAKYCKGDYSWDPKITTPPGLYGNIH